MLRLRRGIVREADDDEFEQRLEVEPVEGGRVRPAIADVSLVGRCEVGDEVVVNVEAVELELDSGGFDIVHVNLTKGLDGEGVESAHVMKLNYSSLQRAMLHVEELDGEIELDRPLEKPVAVISLHSQLAPVAWAFRQAMPHGRLGYVQTLGGALAGSHSQVVRDLCAQGLLAGHITAGAAYGGTMEAVTSAGALRHGLAVLGWDAAVCGPGPGIVGSKSTLGHGGVHALDSAHGALSLGAKVVVVPRMSLTDPRARHRGLSHHTATLLRLLLAPVIVALPAEIPDGAGVLQVDRRWIDRWPRRMARHEWRRAPADLARYGASGLPDEIMKRPLAEEPAFFAAALAGGRVLAEA